MQEIALNILVGCIGLALIIFTGQFVFEVLRTLFELISTVVTMAGGSSPNPHAIDHYHGRIVDARNWHGNKDGKLYSEFWLRCDSGLERRYKLSNVHPNVRKGHNVTLYEYAGHLVAICNQSTGTENWVAPNRLLSSLYPTGRIRSVFIWGACLAIAYLFLKPENPAYQDLFLFLILAIFSLKVLTLLIGHLFSYNNRRLDRINDLSALYASAIDRSRGNSQNEG